MALTSEEKQRIYEEEKTRLEAQERVKKEAAKKRSQKRSMGCLAVLIIFGVLIALGSLLKNDNSPSPAPDAARLQAVDVQKKLDEFFDKMTAAEHLKAAQALITNTASANNVILGKKHLAAIPDTSPERKDAMPVFRLADLRLKALDKEVKAVRAKEQIEAHPLIVVKSTWETGGFDTVALWHVTFRNRSSKPVGNIKYRTVYMSETGQIVGRGGVDSLLAGQPILKVIPPNSERTIEVNDGFLNSQAHKAGFDLVSWEFVSDNR